MSEHYEDLRGIFRTVADGAKQRPGAEGKLLVAARRRRMMTAGAATVSVLLLIGGIAGASMLWQPEDTSPAPPAHSDCRQPPYDIAVFIEDSATEEEIARLRADLVDDHEVEGAIFFSRKDAFEEFKEHYEDQPEFWENLPEDALPMSFQVSLVAGADPRSAARRFKALASVKDVRTYETYEQMDDPRQPATASDCSGEPKQRFARYFFETGSRDASASGVLEVNSQEGTLCYEATTENIQASHLLRNTGVAAGGRRFDRKIVVTFFDPGDREQGAELPSRGGICFQEEQLGELEGDLQVLIDHPEDFRVDFHRGPNDEPGLVAELRESPSFKEERADYYVEESRGFGVHVPEGWNVAQRPLTPHLGDPREILSLGTGPMTPGGSCAQEPVRALEAMDSRDAFISIQERRGDAGHPERPPSFQKQLEGVVFNIDLCTDAEHFRPYWFAFSDAGRDFHLLGALGTEAGAKRTREFWQILDSLDFAPPYDDKASAAEVERRAVSGGFSSIEDAVAYLAKRLKIEVVLPTELPSGARLAAGQSVTVDREGRITSGRLALRYGKKGHLMFDFGRAAFDGCGGDGAVEVDIAGQPGLILAKDDLPWTQIIWPANAGEREATYGVYGSLRSAAMLELARSMPLTFGRGPEKSEGCL